MQYNAIHNVILHNTNNFTLTFIDIYYLIMQIKYFINNLSCYLPVIKLKISFSFFKHLKVLVTL